MIGKRKQAERLRWPREERAVRGVILITALGEDDSAAGPCCASSPSPKGHVKWGDVSPGWARSDALILGPVLWPKKLWPGRRPPWEFFRRAVWKPESRAFAFVALAASRATCP